MEHLLIRKRSTVRPNIRFFRFVLGRTKAAIPLKTNPIGAEWLDLHQPGGNPCHFSDRNLCMNRASLLYVTEITVKQWKMTVA